MKKNIANKWIGALVSGKYKQGKKALKYKTKAGTVRHCCLGVLCELYQKEHKKKIKTSIRSGADDLIGKKVTVFEDCEGTLPEKVMRWAGMTSDEGALGDSCLAEINDAGANFKDIADIIKVDYENL